MKHVAHYQLDQEQFPAFEIIVRERFFDKLFSELLSHDKQDEKLTNDVNQGIISVLNNIDILESAVSNLVQFSKVLRHLFLAIQVQQAHKVK